MFRIRIGFRPRPIFNWAYVGVSVSVPRGALLNKADAINEREDKVKMVSLCA